MLCITAMKDLKDRKDFRKDPRAIKRATNDMLSTQMLRPEALFDRLGATFKRLYKIKIPN